MWPWEQSAFEAEHEAAEESTRRLVEDAVHQQALAANYRPPHLPNELVACDVCGTMIYVDMWEYHVRAVHPKPIERLWVRLLRWLIR